MRKMLVRGEIVSTFKEQLTKSRIKARTTALKTQTVGLTKPRLTQKIQSNVPALRLNKNKVCKHRDERGGRCRRHESMQERWSLAEI